MAVSLFSPCCCSWLLELTPHVLFEPVKNNYGDAQNCVARRKPRRRRADARFVADEMVRPSAEQQQVERRPPCSAGMQVYRWIAVTSTAHTKTWLECEPSLGLLLDLMASNFVTEQYRRAPERYAARFVARTMFLVLHEESDVWHRRAHSSARLVGHWQPTWSCVLRKQWLWGTTLARCAEGASCPVHVM